MSYYNPDQYTEPQSGLEPQNTRQQSGYKRKTSLSDLQQWLEEVRIAKKVLCELYPKAGGCNEPKCAGVVLRRFFLREEDLQGFIDARSQV